MEAACRGGYQVGDACVTWVDDLRESGAREAEEIEASANIERVYEDAFIMIIERNPGA